MPAPNPISAQPTRTHCPLVGIVCDRFFVGDHDVHGVKESYRRALTEVARVAPVFIPASEDIDDFSPYLASLSGLLFPGGASNVSPGRYGGRESAEFLVDRARDHVALHLIRRAADLGIPMLAICRGFQEMNVAFGGTLRADIHAAGHSPEHREDASEDLVARYRYKHTVALARDGMFSAWIGDASARVNSLHTQGIDTLGNNLAVEASTDDGLVEAIRVEGVKFAVGVQWHPEVTADSDPLSRSLFTHFGDACRRYARHA
ncbi:MULTISPECIES: gamma-glutamyl-gamma-aminobutyrate hydrolase family protein [Cupriavidus]|uniref:gamma-glutamyl-gamma-aminobutyrate hydrolase family protein n=1 Tax=Cupriavidus sp. DF5525 TaxID=3160989 RepID=UPI0003B06912|nr:hypothetical protein N234_12840 [Ralstonia pickettii DTP0602]